MNEIFNYTCFINPPTKNEKKSISVYSRRAGRRVPMTNHDYTQVWELIHNEMYLKRFGMSKGKFKLLPKKEIIRLQKTLYTGNVIFNFWNGFKKIDLYNIHDELLDRLQGVAYINDRQVKQGAEFKDDFAEKEYFKIIIEVVQ